MTEAEQTQLCEPFAEITNEQYGPIFAVGCEVSPTARGIRLSSKCPRCEGMMSYDKVEKFSKALRRGKVASEPRAESAGVVHVMCTCKRAHPGCPADDEGCGAYWTVEVSVE